MEPLEYHCNNWNHWNIIAIIIALKGIFASALITLPRFHPYFLQKIKAFDACTLHDKGRETQIQRERDRERENYGV